MKTRTVLLQVNDMSFLKSIIRLRLAIKDLLGQLDEDLALHKGDWTMPGFRAIAVHRVGTWLSSRRAGIVKSVLLALYHVMYRYIRNHYGIEIPLTAIIGRRLEMVHQHGIVFHWKATVGDDCLIRHNATIGAGYGPKTLHKGPSLGHRVEVGAGAVIFAGVKIGDGAVIGPNAVVMSDVPAGAKVFVEAPRRICSLPSTRKSSN